MRFLWKTSNYLSRLKNALFLKMAADLKHGFVLKVLTETVFVKAPKALHHHGVMMQKLWCWIFLCDEIALLEIWKSEFRYSEIAYFVLDDLSISVGIFVKTLPHLRCVAVFTNVSACQQKLWFGMHKSESKKWFPYHRTADVKPSGIFNIALSLALTEFCARTLNSLACSLVKCPCEFTLSRFARWVICMEAISFGEGDSFNKE